MPLGIRPTVDFVFKLLFGSIENTGVLEMIDKSPELRLIYDDRAKEEKDRYSLLKDARAEALELGRLIEGIQRLQQFLGDPVSLDAELSTLERETLKEKIRVLELRFLSDRRS